MHVSKPGSVINFLCGTFSPPSLIQLPYFMIARTILCHLWWYTCTEMQGSNTYRYSEGSAVFLFACLSLESAAKFTKQSYSSTTCILEKKQTNNKKKNNLHHSSRS